MSRRTSRDRGPGWRPAPEVVVLEPRPGAPRSPKPPVRIFVGTEPLQHRAERVLVWSVEQVRDPGRVYEIHLMKDLAGFDRRRWLTGFTNYRFAIPHLGGRTGRAIYNDVDQIYLADPAELFDADLHGQGFLALSPQDTAVMLIDCERMAAVWPLEAAQHERRKAVEAVARAQWGRLDPAWHARDWEYEPVRTKVLHYTTIHWQPWQPFPQHFVYHSTPAGHVWHELERGADRAGFQIFTAERPSAAYRALVARLREARPNVSGRSHTRPAPAALAPELDALLKTAGVHTVLAYAFGSDEGGLAHEHRAVTRRDPTWPGAGEVPAGAFDAVVCTEGLERVPGDDIPWVVDFLFERAHRIVHAVVRDEARTQVQSDGSTVELPPRGQEWWAAHFAAASVRHPDVHCRVLFEEPASGGRRRVSAREWGRRLSGPPQVWILADDKAGHATQSVGLAETLGWPYEIKDLRFNALNRMSHLLGASLVSLDRSRSAPLVPPWPDVVISTGRRTAPVARWIGKASGGRSRLVQLGRKGGEVVDAFDAVVTCAHFRLPLHQRRIETVAPLNAVTPARLAEAAGHWRGLFGDAARPHVVLVVGGTSALHRLDADTARRMAQEVRAAGEAAGGTVFAITSPRTGAAATAALEVVLTAPHRVHVWRRGERLNPYLGYLALADVLVVTGESESMLAEAAAAGKPLYIFPLPRRTPKLRDRVRGWIVARAYVRPQKTKGTIRPQQGLEYACARLIERGIVQPLRDLDQLHEGLVRLGVARRFGGPLEGGPCQAHREMDEVARRIRALVGVTDPPCRSDDLDLADRGSPQVSAG